MSTSSVKTRLIPVLLLRNGILVRSRNFSFYQVTGNPFLQVERFNTWNVDELIYLDISREGKVVVDQTNSVIGATSAKKKLFDKEPEDIYEFVRCLSKRCFMPLTFGGGLKNIEQIRKILQSGADKIAINTYAYLTPELITKTAESYGKQCVVVSIDCKRTSLGFEVFIEGGKTATGVTAVEWAKKVEQLGAGEILLNSIDRDGMGGGYDIELCRSVVCAVNIPVIILGGIGQVEDFSKGYHAIKPHALAAANIFHFIEHSDRRIKMHLAEEGVNVRI